MDNGLPAVQVHKVCKTFKSGATTIAALKEVDFTTYLGELLMIVGPSGCGKTTLLSAIAGTLQCDSGTINVLNCPLQEMTEKRVTEFRKKNIGFIFQQFHLIKTLTCLENVVIPLLLNGIDYAQAKERALVLLEKVGLKGREEEKPSLLSGGQQQRVAIARALIHDPPLVICDEPTAALDGETGAGILELMRSIIALGGRTMIVVTHDNRIFKYADRIVKMDDGKIIA